jgi:hypothetical protein
MLRLPFIERVVITDLSSFGMILVFVVETVIL